MNQFIHFIFNIRFLTFMSVDAESIENGSFGINLLEVRVVITHSASLMSGERDERLAV